jgi:hypothetical protein
MSRWQHEVLGHGFQHEQQEVEHGDEVKTRREIYVSQQLEGEFRALLRRKSELDAVHQVFWLVCRHPSGGFQESGYTEYRPELETGFLLHHHRTHGTVLKPWKIPDFERVEVEGGESDER